MHDARDPASPPHQASKGAASDDSATMLWRRAQDASEAGRFRDLERFASELSALAVAGRGETSEANARALTELAYALRRQGKYAAAEPVLRRLVAIQEQLHGPDHPGLGLTLDLLAAAVSRAHPERMSEVKKLESRAAHVRLKRR